MEIFGIIKIINIAGIIQGLFLSAAIFHARTKGRKCLVFLSLLILVYSLGNLANIIIHSFFSEYYWHRFILIPFFAAIGPAFYFYISSFTDYTARIPKIFHFISLILIAAGFIINMITKIHDFGPLDVVDIIISVAIAIQVIIYSALSIAALLSYQKKIHEYFSSMDKFRILWLRLFIIASFVSWISLLIIEYSHAREDAFGIFWLFISIIVYAVGYIGIKQPEILEHIEVTPKKKYEKTAIDPDKLKEYTQKLMSSVKENVFLDPDISLPSLADQIGVHSYQLSQIINEKGMNFYEYINRLRIDYAKNLIKENLDILNIARVAFDSGFNSISAFNSAFKKFSGVTPSEFAKKNA
jgi:AraC-like DNA-binding protein